MPNVSLTHANNKGFTEFISDFNYVMQISDSFFSKEIRIKAVLILTNSQKSAII